MFNLRFYQATGAEITRKQTLQVPGCYQTQIDAVKLAYFPDSAQVNWKWHQPNALYFRRRMVLIGIFPLLGLVLKTSLDFSWTWLVLCILWLPVVAWWQWQFFKRVRYGLSEAGLLVKSGFFTQYQTLLMLHNVQAVELEQGFMDARYALADLTLYTASGTVEIEALPLTMVRSLRDFVLAKIEVPKELNM
jgi:putative membrane protein